jgi:hypothetical protein
MGKKDLDLETATRKELVDKILNQKREINNLLGVIERATGEHVRMRQVLDGIKKVAKRG